MEGGHCQGGQEESTLREGKNVDCQGGLGARSAVRRLPKQREERVRWGLPAFTATWRPQLVLHQGKPAKQAAAHAAFLWHCWYATASATCKPGDCRERGIGGLALTNTMCLKQEGGVSDTFAAYSQAAKRPVYSTHQACGGDGRGHTNRRREEQHVLQPAWRTQPSAKQRC